MIKYSIIVPFYNAESYIRRTLDCLKKIDRDYIEIIIINDGSTDNTLTILQEYMFKNSKIISTINKGVSAARNIGIENSSGKYITFLDGDDWLDEKLFDKLNEYYDKDYDIVRYGFYFSDINQCINRTYKITDKNQLINLNKERKNIINDLICTRKYNSTCNQIIKRSILIDKKIRFDETKKYAEDYKLNLNLYNIANSLYLLEDCYYYYYINSIGTTNSYNFNNILKCLNDSIDIYINSIKEFKENIIDYNNALASIYNEIIICLKKLYRIKGITNKEIKKVYSNFYNNNNIVFLFNAMKKNKYKCHSIFECLVFSKNILLFNRIILLYFKIKIL